jgi:hypothetical protein
MRKKVEGVEEINRGCKGGRTLIIQECEKPGASTQKGPDPLKAVV